MGEYSGSTYHRYFDSWNNAVEKAGFKPRESRRNLADDKKRFYKYGNGWRSICWSVRKRDNYECQSCGIKNKKHKDEYDKSLEVHHLIKLEEFFDDFSDEEHNKLLSDNSPQSLIKKAERRKDIANKKENLVSLCTSCHYNIETKDLDEQLEIVGMNSPYEEIDIPESVSE